MKLPTQPYKGTRDFYPEDMRLRKWMFGKWRDVLESFGYEEYDGPVLESLDLFTAKTSEEIVNEQSFNFEDRGGRKIIMRPEMTPTVSRMVAKKRQELGYPLRLYSIPNCFRYERQQRGRLREFWQLNADIFGVEGVEADIENIMLADAIMQAFGAKRDQYEIRINSRVTLDAKISQAKPKAEKNEILSFLDKKDKMSPDEFAEKLSDYVSDTASLLKWLQSDDIEEQSQDLKQVIKTLNQYGVSNAKFDPAIIRGFDYYTDIVFEVFDKNPDNNRSMFGGGRYDGLVGEFGVEPVPTVGFGMGDVTFANFLESNNLIPKLETETDIYIIPIGADLAACQKLAQELRQKGLNVAVDISGKKLDKQIKTADKKGIKNVLFVGQDELAKGQYNLKNLETGQEQTLTVEQIFQTIKG